MARARTIRLDDIPIPEDARAHANWPPFMLEMAAHIGAYATLLIVDAFAGQDVYVSLKPEASKFADLVDERTVRIISSIYGGQRVAIPTGRNALLQARRAGVIAAVRANRMTVSEGAAIVRANRRHFSRLVNHSDEGDCAPLALPARPRDPAQLEMFGEP